MYRKGESIRVLIIAWRKEI